MRFNFVCIRDDVILVTTLYSSQRELRHIPNELCSVIMIEVIESSKSNPSRFGKTSSNMKHINMLHPTSQISNFRTSQLSSNCTNRNSLEYLHPPLHNSNLLLTAIITHTSCDIHLKYRISFNTEPYFFPQLCCLSPNLTQHPQTSPALSTKTPVLIIGGGIVGLSASLFLTSHSNLSIFIWWIDYR